MRTGEGLINPVSRVRAEPTNPWSYERGRTLAFHVGDEATATRELATRPPGFCNLQRTADASCASPPYAAYNFAPSA